MQKRPSLPENANRPLEEGEIYRPYVAPETSPHEFTAKALFFGILFGILFGAANAYLGLRAGLTISTSSAATRPPPSFFRSCCAMTPRKDSESMVRI